MINCATLVVSVEYQHIFGGVRLSLKYTTYI